MSHLTRHFRACDLCEALCGLEFHSSDGELLAIRGDAADPFSKGHICPKGNAMLDLEADPDRLRVPMRREGSVWREIDWDEALEFAGQRLAEIQAKHGDDALGIYVGNPNVHHLGHLAYLPPLLRAFRSRNVYSASSVDQWPHQLVCWAMYGHQFLLPIPDLDETDYFLMLGANPVASNGSLMSVPGVSKRLDALVQRGRLVVVDPRRTETAQRASEHLPIRPGTDVWLLIGILQTMMQTGAPRLAHYRGRLADWDRAMAVVTAINIGSIQDRTGIPDQQIQRIAAELYAAERSVVYGRMGVSTQTHGSLCQWLMQLCNLYTGQLDRCGGILPNDAVWPLTGPGTGAGHRDCWRSRVRGLPEFAGELPVAALAEEIETPGPGQIRAMFTCAGNPALSCPDGARLERGFANLEFMVSVDIYRNETTRHADLILPPASPLTQYHYDLIFNGFAIRRVARLNAPLRAQPEHERADWQILSGLGLAYAKVSGKSFQALPDPLSLVGLGLSRGGSGMTVQDLLAAPHGLDLGPLRPNLLDRLQTASGHIECAPTLFLDELASLAQSTSQAPDANELLLIGRRHVRSNNSWMHNAPRLIKGKSRHQLQMHPQDLQERGLQDGERVRLRSSAGTIDTEVIASDELSRGVVCLPHGFGHDQPGVQLQRASQVQGANYNVLSDALRIDRPSGNAALNGLPVTVERLGSP